MQLKSCLELSKQNKLTFIFILLANFLFAPNLNPENLSKYLLNYPNLDDPDGEVIFNNEYVVLQKLIVGPGEWEGVHSHPGNQIYVHVKGGYWSGRMHGELEYEKEFSPDGSVGWMGAIPIEDRHDSGNSGDAPIELIYVTLKNDASEEEEGDTELQTYPYVDLELLFDNHRFFVQKVILNPGEWEGTHLQTGRQISIIIKGRSISSKRNGEYLFRERNFSPGDVEWLESESPNDTFERGNEGEETIEYVLVTIK